jgi:hypothetical protein
MLKNLFRKYKRIIVVNEISFIGDSIVFFWPMVNGLISAFPYNEVSVFHPHYDLFKPTNETIQNRPLNEFYDHLKTDETTLVIAFIKSDGQLREHLKLNGFQCIVKGMVGLDFICFNLPDFGI